MQTEINKTIRARRLKWALVCVLLIATVPACRAKNAADARAAIESKAAREAACAVSPECQDRKAMLESLIEDGPQQSTSGKWFFQGEACGEDCSGHVAGYRWAERIGATKEAACEDANSTSFQEGCLSFVKSYEPEIDAGEEYSGEENEDYGRYR